VYYLRSIVPNQLRQDYRAFLKAHPQLPVFYQDWWLDAICGIDNWSVVIAYENEGQPAGCWPYYISMRFRGLISTLDQPPFTRFCGPLIGSPEIDLQPARALSRNNRILRELSQQLPRRPLRRATTHYDFDQAQPLIKLGWRARRFYSYRLRSDQFSAAELYERLDGKVRTDLRKVEPTGQRIQPLKDPTIVSRLQQRVYDHRSQQSEERRFKSFRFRPGGSSKEIFPAAGFERLFSAAGAHGQAVGWTFHDQADRVVAAVWLPYDKTSAYLSIAASDPDVRHEEAAISQLIWHAVQWCVRRKLIFDFEGSSLPGVEEFYRGWGPEVAKY
jgi:hypothetical protein